ncbi:MAG: class I SAM-dependent methyltransferase [Pseudomonadota bacterium]|nr:MAG: class I SAM-dependent methyltransferase [Pseudomonadota bacterium]
MTEATAQATPSQVAAVFDLVAPGYDQEALRFFPFIADRLIAQLRPAAGDKLLDVACGTGAVAIAAAQAVGPGGRVTAIDLSEGMLARLQAKLTKFGVANVDLHVMDGGALEFRRDYFNHVVSSFGLFFLSDMSSALAQWRRVTRPGGTVMFTSFAPLAFTPMIDLLRARLVDAGVDMPPQELADSNECQALMTAAGLMDVNVKTEQMGYHLRNELEWWEIVWHSALRGPCERLAPAQLEEVRVAHLEEVACLRTDKGLWLNVETHFVRGRKPA